MAGQEKIEHNTGVALGVRVALGAQDERQLKLRASSQASAFQQHHVTPPRVHASQS